MSAPALPPETALGAVELTVRNLDRTLDFYSRNLGFAAQQRDGGLARLGDAGGETLLRLVENPAARPARNATGLYHFAVLVPTRADLAALLHRLERTATPLQGASDHGVSEALYLADPDENGIEIYRDRRRDEWPRRDGRLEMRSDPLDLDNLFGLAGADGGQPLPAGTRIGHVHLHVADLERALAFYRDSLGFELQQTYGSQAAFVSAGGYHHHVGLNTWRGRGAPPPPPDATGLRHFEVRLPDRAGLAAVIERLTAGGVASTPHGGGYRVADPSGNTLVLLASNPQS